MVIKRLVIFLLAMMVVLVGLVRSGEAANQAPFVSNVEVKQTDIDHVLIRYDVAEADGDKVTISLHVSDDGGILYIRRNGGR
jgi:hypothetical protein